MREFLGPSIAQCHSNSSPTVECGDRLCAFSLEHNDQDAFSVFRDALGKRPFAGSLFFTFDEETNTTSIYLARKGADLPRVD
jgi:hypothetical protein